ncbi:hypothetical protein PtrSN002B_001399 [Pyrenophora tritici-repentis]|uniref:FAP multi-domain protein n=2 Tax=Pyrenophora tritici-repentis TaxID=45151 RepID=A0A2W1DRW9_9PLEO|nr:uncharacterized protein PTRG_04176 [Pyrenophora tritici-repentis Pt-1C-BFP]KAA8619734.1 hypothetical protein PtrV1_06828 [Pyrenophora tritici-repentis]EDU47014.1 hypothetical protein PTRG_04176 [Pyrenophora tritici-repentis Pt-1C-BFP]KAF7447874.1 hypothetical protein A1F99_072380 [Pyrenophora tritici-repentis]KAF7571574.1 FAP multi-domain protein [Pyrenophora tritici-repentis]KAG9385200.1 hypothetical protein A1F94_004747 [Pyrenophora tritici-repentis]
MLGSTVFAAVFFALAQFAVASPPGCLLGAVNQFKDPSDVKTVCSAKDLSEKVSGICGGDAQAAMEALADICNNAGVKLSSTDIKSGYVSASAVASAYISAGTAGSTLVAMYPTGGSYSSGGNSTVPMATGGPKPTAAATPSGNAPEATGAAGKVEFGLAAVVAGMMVAVL